MTESTFLDCRFQEKLKMNEEIIQALRKAFECFQNPGTEEFTMWFEENHVIRRKWVHTSMVPKDVIFKVIDEIRAKSIGKKIEGFNFYGQGLLDYAKYYFPMDDITLGLGGKRGIGYPSGRRLFPRQIVPSLCPQ